MKIEEALTRLKTGKKKKFLQTVDLIVNLKNIDVKKPENRISKDIVLPHGRGKEVSVGIISDTAPDGIRKTDIESMIRNKKAAKKMVNDYDFFLCEAPLMPLVGKSLGRYMGPRGKMPKPMPPGRDPKPLIELTKKCVKVRILNSPSIQIPVGREDMTDENIRENINHVINEIKKSLPGKSQIKNSYVKLTMGKPLRIEV